MYLCEIASVHVQSKSERRSPTRSADLNLFARIGEIHDHLDLYRINGRLFYRIPPNNNHNSLTI